jgi:HAE1 family hydrophobic/amphiphilic exporter-1
MKSERRRWPRVAASLTVLLSSGLGVWLTTAGVIDEDVLVVGPEEAVALALSDHPSLLEEAQRVEQVGRLRRQALARAYPQVTAKASGVRSRDPGFLNSPGFEDFAGDLGFDPTNLVVPITTYDYRIGVEQILYAFGKVGAGVRALEAMEQKSRTELSERQLEVARDAEVACYGLALAGERIEVLESERASRERQVGQARDFLEIGKGTRLQLLQARAGLANLRPREIQARGDLARARSTLNASIGRPALDPVRARPGLLDESVLPDLPPIESLIEASQARPELRALAEERQAKDLEGKVARTNLLPELRFDGSYGIRTIRTDNLFDGDFESWDAGIYLEWKLFDGRETRARLAEIRAQQAESRFREQARGAEIARDLVSQVAEYDRAREAAAAAEEASRQAEEAHRVAGESFRYGAATLLDLLEAERTLTESRFQRLGAIHDALIALAEIRFLTGRLPGEPLLEAP